MFANSMMMADWGERMRMVYMPSKLDDSFKTHGACLSISWSPDEREARTGIDAGGPFSEKQLQTLAMPGISCCTGGLQGRLGQWG